MILGPAGGIAVLLWFVLMGIWLVGSILGMNWATMSGNRNPELNRKIRANRKVLRARERCLAENLGGMSYGPYRGELLNSLRAVLLTEGAWNALSGGSTGRLIDRKIENELWDLRVDRVELISAVCEVGRDWKAAVGSLKLEPVSGSIRQ